jgi:hypothetical protein
VIAETAQLFDGLMQFVDKRGYWPGCPQSRRIGVYTKLARDQVTEVVSPCSPKCVKARKAIESAGGTVVQQSGRDGI